VSLYGDGQLGLFSAPPEVDPHTELRHLGRALPSGVRFGTSSWTFEGWAGRVYHQSYKNKKAFVQESLREYAKYPLFRTVGIDRSYYAPVDAETLKTYASMLPEDFVCVSKVWSELTTRIFPRHHARAGQVNRKFLDPELFSSVYAPYREAFAPHAGPFVVEVPPSAGPVNARGFADAVERFLAAAPGNGYSHDFAFELRDERLFSARYAEVLRSYGASHVFNAWSHMPSIAKQLEWMGDRVGPVTVARLMLPRGGSYATMKEAYKPFDKIVKPQPQMREDALRLIRLALEAHSPAFVIVNNKAEGCSPASVEALARALVA
jgi:uncharacterized protein YecE (DUF72 family)